MCNNRDSILPLIDVEGRGRGDSSRTRPLYHLPPGCRFCPTDEELLNDYLTGKNSSVAIVDRAEISAYDLIRELDLYDYEPSDMPEGTCFVHGYRGRKRHWFCYTKSTGRRKRKRTARGGFWSKIGKARDVIDGRNVVLGTRTKFLFYEVNSAEEAVKTPWIMHEYALHRPLEI